MGVPRVGWNARGGTGILPVDFEIEPAGSGDRPERQV